MLITSAPWSTAYRMPRATTFSYRASELKSRNPGSSSSRMTRTESTLAAGATPITPSERPGPCPCPAISEAM